MKSVFALFLLAAISGGALFAQRPPSDFGQISMEELSMRRYEKDTSAGAVILFHKGESFLSEDLSAVIKMHQRVKFFTKQEIDNLSQITIYLNHGTESISKLKASTYNVKDGKIVESRMDPNAVFKSRFDKETDQVKFSLPNVVEGSVIEYSYTISTSASLLPGWTFQFEIPNLWSEYHTHIPNAFTFRKDMQGFLPLTRHEEDKQGNNEKWIMVDVPAFKEEAQMTTPEDYVSKVTFFIASVFVPGRPLYDFTTTWEKMVEELNTNPSFGGQLRNSGFLSKIVEGLTTGITEPEKKVKAIYDYVKANVEWNGDLDKIPDHNFKKVLEDKKGSSSEINLLMVTMMKKAGLMADPVLISTRKHGQIRPFNPRFEQVNDVIASVVMGEKRLFLDGTDRTLPMNSIPERCLNGNGLVASVDHMEWVPIASAKARRVVSADIKVAVDGELSTQLSVTRDGLYAGRLRKTVTDMGKEKYTKEVFSGKGWEIAKSEFSNLDNPNESFKEVHDVTIRDHAQATGQQIYLNPYVYGRREENEFKTDKREYPVDFATPFDEFYLAKIVCPDDYVIDELPKSKILMLPEGGGKFVYSATANGNTINFISQIVIAKSVYLPEQYGNLKEFFSQVVAKQAEQIVFKKKP
ncbi:MAG: DUF3857 and transglutaminase domain-containing protein [Cyclobacteriaceae bacterium]|nr:DUF3857 and transglutaminase domain-containing protein [Cyclobacteriaceae bacterium]